MGSATYIFLLCFSVCTHSSLRGPARFIYVVFHKLAAYLIMPFFKTAYGAVQSYFHAVSALFRLLFVSL